MMPVQTDLKTFDSLANEIGGGAALMLCAFFGASNRSLYVPSRIPEGHILEKLIGADAASWLAAEHGGQTLNLPSLEGLRHIRSAGLIAGLARHGVPQNLMAAACDLTPRRIQQIREQLAREGFGSLLEHEIECEVTAQ